MGAVKSTFAVGKECDAWCTKCKRDTLHNIIALDEDGKPAQVECRSCNGAHKYRAPKAAADKPAAGATKAAPKRVAAKTQTKAALAAAAAPAAIYKRWEELVGKNAGVAGKSYAVTGAYGVDDVVEHATFGLGFVLEASSFNRIKVIFQDAERTLIARHGQKPA